MNVHQTMAILRASCTVDKIQFAQTLSEAFSVLVKQDSMILLSTVDALTIMNAQNHLFVAQMQIVGILKEIMFVLLRLVLNIKIAF